MSNLTSAFGAAAGAIAGGSSDTVADAAAGANSGKNAVENNYLGSQEHQEKKELEYEQKNGQLTSEQMERLEQLKAKNETTTEALFNACQDVDSEACKAERQKAYNEMESYQNLTYQNPKVQQKGYQEIDRLLKATSAEGELMRQIYDGYKNNYLSLGYSEDEAGVMAGHTISVQMITHGITGTINLPILNKIFSGSKLVGLEKIKVTEIKTSQPIDFGEFNRLNQKDIHAGKIKPAEASAAVEIQNSLGGQLKRIDSNDSSADFVFISGPNKGKTVDFMFTTGNGTAKEINGLNKFFDKNWNTNIKTLTDHLGKADIVPLDFRNLTQTNQQKLINYIKSLSPSEQKKIIIMR